MALPKIRLLVDIIGVYSCFLHWAYLQELITSTDFRTDTTTAIPGGATTERWTHSIVLNLCMALGSFVVGGVALLVKGRNGHVEKRDGGDSGDVIAAGSQEKLRESSSRSLNGSTGSAACLVKKCPLTAFIKPALFFTLASPFGYAALRYLSYPTVVVIKSIKLLPVMVVSSLFGSRQYSRHEYGSALIITAGVAMYTLAKRSIWEAPAATNGSSDLSFMVTIDSDVWKWGTLGVVLVGLNIVMDGLTIAAQDDINHHYSSVGSFDMQCFVNLWCVVIMTVYLVCTQLVLGDKAELHQAITFTHRHPEVIPYIVRFGLCAAIGQMFVYDIIKHYGGLTNMAVAMSRKCVTVILSIMLFNHKVNAVQMFGIACVFVGLGLHQWGVDKRKAKAIRDKAGQSMRLKSEGARDGGSGGGDINGAVANGVYGVAESKKVR